MILNSLHDSAGFPARCRVHSLRWRTPGPVRSSPRCSAPPPSWRSSSSGKAVRGTRCSSRRSTSRRSRRCWWRRRSCRCCWSSPNARATRRFAAGDVGSGHLRRQRRAVPARMVPADRARLSLRPRVAVYLHISAAGPVLASGFWLIASERFDPHTAKKRFGHIARGRHAGRSGERADRDRARRRHVWRPRPCFRCSRCCSSAAPGSSGKPPVCAPRRARRFEPMTNPTRQPARSPLRAC